MTEVLELLHPILGQNDPIMTTLIMMVVTIGVPLIERGHASLGHIQITGQDKVLTRMRPKTPSSYSKSDGDCKTESFYLEMEKRGKDSSKLEGESKRTSENEAMKRCYSPTNEQGFRRGSSYSKHGKSASRYKPAPSKPAPKSDKFKNSLCCTELNEEIKQSNSFSLQTPCSKGKSDLAAFCTSKRDTVLMSSDDSVTGSEVSPLVKTCMLSSNGFQNINRCKEKFLDDTCMQHSKSESPFRETEPPVSPHQDQLISLPVMTIDYSKTIVKEPVDKDKGSVQAPEISSNSIKDSLARMQCECTPLSKDERAQGEIACGKDCLNHLLMIECSSRCPNGDYCFNRRFQRKQHADVEVILTEKKGWGLRAAKDLPSNTFVLEYCGEVLDHKQFKARVKDCEPNCETQKWTVNGQLRVGIFTTKLVPSGSELTFDYQFRKEAQRCFCGLANCRGYLGGENRVSIRAAGGKMKEEQSWKKDSVDGELEALMENGEGLSDKNQVFSLYWLTVRIETLEQKLTCLKLIQNTHSQSCLKSFLECHGLPLLWIWMAELCDGREKGDGYSSENTSRAHTPLNTPDPSTKLSIEADTDTPKKLMFCRLKIISENGMDSAISDATSELEGKDGKEDLDQLENVPIEEEKQQLLTQQLPESKLKLPTSEPEADTEIEPKESNGTKLDEPIAEEAPSQDEEEGVSDVESERRQEQPHKTVDISDLATKLLDSWKDLKEVYRIPKKRQTEKESTITERGRDAVGFRDQTVAPKTPNRGSLSPPSPAYERGTKRTVRIKDHNQLFTEERRKLFEQEVAQWEAQKQQQQMQNLGMMSPLPYDSLGYHAPHHPFAGYPPCYPMQAYVDPSNPNAGKVLLPTPSMDPVCSPSPYDYSQPLVGHSTEPLAAPPPVPVVPHVAAPVEVSSSQYVAQSNGVVHQDPSITILPVPAPGSVQGQNYGVWDSNQQSMSIQQQYSPAQSQATIYYQRQACPTVYGVTSPYSQTTPPIVQSYAQPSLQYIQGQQIFTVHPRGVVVQPATAMTTIVVPG
ncbi:hypothetical protein EI555_015067 [Monodon monoceros]|uniref:Histone-lysine N-methyltransferase SETD2 n=1 Tax=Monodon monoceros TaxID=40151 RepID=A0A4U1EF65_MONMO|nr:hypothetical protein EI555_015067 [Monodon monoceros]